MPKYQVLSQEEQDDIIVSFMLSQEKDKFCLELNLNRYKDILSKGDGKGKWHDRVKELQAESIERLAEIDSIIEASMVQMPTPERVETAKQRIEAAQQRPANM